MVPATLSRSDDEINLIPNTPRLSDLALACRWARSWSDNIVRLQARVYNAVVTPLQTISRTLTHGGANVSTFADWRSG